MAIRAELARSQVQFEFREADNALGFGRALHRGCLPVRGRPQSLARVNDPRMGNRDPPKRLAPGHFRVEQKGHANVTRPPLTRAGDNSILAIQIVLEELRMNSKITPLIAAIIAIAAIMIPIRIQGQSEKGSHHHYKLIDVGTFGGPGGSISN